MVWQSLDLSGEKFSFVIDNNVIVNYFFLQFSSSLMSSVYALDSAVTARKRSLEQDGRHSGGTWVVLSGTTAKTTIVDLTFNSFQFISYRMMTS